MTLTTRNAGVAGILYLLLAIAAPLRLLIIPGKLFVTGDATATAENILANETLFRLGILSDLFCGVILILLALALYRLFREVDPTLAVLMAVLGGMVPAAIDFINVVHDSAALMLVRGPDFLSVFDKPQRDALAMMFLRLHGQQVIAAEILWGLWLLPLGLLTLRSGFFPRFLGVWLIFNCFAYLAESVTGLFFPEHLDTVSMIVFPAILGEIAFVLWLLIRGLKPAGTGPAAA